MQTRVHKTFDGLTPLMYVCKVRICTHTQLYRYKAYMLNRDLLSFTNTLPTKCVHTTMNAFIHDINICYFKCTAKQVYAVPSV